MGAKLNLDQAERAVNSLEILYKNTLIENPDLNRQIVSFQNSKKLPFSRWFRYKEGFASELVEYCLTAGDIRTGPILDPFAGSGTTLFTANRLGLESIGVEVLPIAQEIIKIQELALSSNSDDLVQGVVDFLHHAAWKTLNHGETTTQLNEIAITAGAYSADNKAALERYLHFASQESESLARLLRFAALCVLESISFTRKDGQFLRWDHRSGRSRGRSATQFNKGKIWTFDDAIQTKLNEILIDLRTISFAPYLDRVSLIEGSILRRADAIKPDSISAVITSPPYLNRYDYTRTYALELAFLGLNDNEIKDLRQELLSATVENREKDLAVSDAAFQAARLALEEVDAFMACKSYLFGLLDKGELNNTGITKMFVGYFLELSATLFHVSKKMKSGAYFYMVNDNVRYGGLAIPVDLILCEVAKQFGLITEKVWVLPGKKGNSSQQMGDHGRLPLRKCVYVWRKL